MTTEEKDKLENNLKLLNDYFLKDDEKVCFIENDTIKEGIYVSSFKHLGNGAIYFEKHTKCFKLFDDSFLSLRILRYSLYGIGICFVSVLFILYQKIFTDNAIPGWASSLILIISGIILQLFSVTLIVLLLQLSSRKNISAPNSKIYKNFIKNEENFNKN